MNVQIATSRLAVGPKLTNLSYSEKGTRYEPFGQDIRDLSLLGFDSTARKIVRSADDGATWEPFCEFVFPAVTVQHIAYLPDGEVLVGTGVGYNAAGQVTGSTFWRSSGWSNPSTATFTMTHAFAPALSMSYGGWSARDNVIMVSEYGPQTDQGTPTQARRAWLSRDGGRTFAMVFDLNTTTVDGETGPWGGPTRRQHLHGCAYDPFWDRLWLAVGDGTGTAGKTAVIYSDNDGATWQGAYVNTQAHWQCVLPYALEHAVVFGSDFNASGLRRVGRAGYRDATAFGAAHVMDDKTGIALIGMHAYQAPGVTDAPALFTFEAIGADYPGAVAATFDGGRTFNTIYKDPLRNGGVGLQYAGLYRTFGPTNTGRFVVLSSDTLRFPTGARMVGDLREETHQEAAESTEVVIPAKSFHPASTSIADISVVNTVPVYRMDADTNEALTAVVDVPDHWKQYDVELVWINTSSAAGDVAWQLYQRGLPDAGGFGPPSSKGVKVTPAATVALSATMTVWEGVAAAPGPQVVHVQRRGADAEDSLPNDAGVLFVRLRKAI